MAAFEFNPCVFYGESFTDISEILQRTPKDIDVNNTNISSILNSHLIHVTTNPKFVIAPDIKDLQWLNTTRPLTFEFDLADKVYILDFFTSCCINCIHILPILKAVETEYNDDSGFAVIGVHSPKFYNEKDLSSLKDFIALYNITHPVLNDSDCLLWMKYSITCWPTVFIIGPSHKLLFILVGETQINKLSFLCKIIKKFYDFTGEVLDSKSIPLSPVENPIKDGILYPGNISTNNELLAVSNTGSNLILLMTRSLKLEEIIGSGIAGDQDGPFKQATFNSPHGTTWCGTSVYVADTGNHSIRKIDFISKQVLTVFKQKECDDSSEEFSRGFLSPWDVCMGPELGTSLTKLNTLYIAVAGSHQIWFMNLESKDLLCAPFAGSGKEENRGNFYKFHASFAQPTGIDYSEASPNFLYVADSESSAIRSISLIDGAVSTVCGGSFDPMDLYSFGDKDGTHLEVKFQHPMSLCVINEHFLAVADTYNHKIKLVDVTKRSSQTITKLTGLCEPGGICICDNTLYIADTHHHHIKCFSLEPDLVSKLINPPLQKIDCFEIRSPSYKPVKIEIKYGSDIKFFFNLKKSAGCILAKQEVPWEILFKGNGQFNIKCNSSNLFDPVFGTPHVELKAEEFSLIDGYNSTKECELTFILHVDVCGSSLGVCMSKIFHHKIHVKFMKYGSRIVHVHILANE